MTENAHHVRIPEGLDATLVMVRHGETTWIAEGRFQGQADVPLSPIGERQARLAAERIADPTRSPILPIPGRRPLEIVHSPLVRARFGAERVAEAIAARPHGTTIPLRPDPGFIEFSQGLWEGMHRTEIEARYPDELAAWRRTPHEANAPEGERIADVGVRARAAVERLLANLAAAPKPPTRSQWAAGYPPPAAPDTPWSVLVGHDGIFKASLCAIFGFPLARFWAFPFGLCGITVVEFRAGAPILRAHNLTEHLAPLLDEVAIGEVEERQRSGAL